MAHHKFYLGDVMNCLKLIPDNSVQCVVTSPPYWGLRDYGVDGQIGLEKSPDEFIGKMVEVFREVRRVLRPDGTAWVNFGDSYAGSWGNYSPTGKGGQRNKKTERFDRKGYVDKESWRPPTSNNIQGLKPKDLCGIPWRFALALQADGWYLRADIIWFKPNPMPGSVEDRPTKSHEYIFLLSKSASYYYDNEAVKEEASPESQERYKYNFGGEKAAEMLEQGIRIRPRGKKETDGKRNKRTVWEIPTEPCPAAHFATFPQKLVEPCILAGTSPKACQICGSPWKRIKEPSEAYKPFIGKSYHDHSNDKDQGMSQKKTFPRTFSEYITVDWEPTCKCEANDGSGRCIVLDPFGGSGTVALVSSSHGRDSIYIDLNPDYLEIALDRNDFNGLCHADTYDILRS